MLRNMGAVVLGMIVGMVVNMILISVNGYVLFPMPEGMDMYDPEQLSGYIETLPAAGMILPILAHLGQAFVGGWVAARLGASRPLVLAMIVGVLSLVGGIMNAMSIPLPTWTYIEMPLYLVVAWFAGSLEVKRRAASA